ncbi:hypothetical protein KHQ81_13035 [Mycoplasmatota bacterium]|nr:hypothetical protein KHQ81_13035 [Mycoplasmatota bacterium]
MLNMSEVIKKVENVIGEKRFGAREDVRNILLKNCKRLAEECNPFNGDYVVLLQKGSNFIKFEEETTFLKKRTKTLHHAYRVKIYGPYNEQIFYANVLGPAVKKFKSVVV